VIQVAIKIATTNISKTITGIQDAWKNSYPDYLYKSEFMDQVVSRRYGFFNMVFTFMAIASVIAIFIGCLGMYGLISFVAVQRTKEIGIRKVFGATVRNIIMMFTRESGFLVVISFVMAVPVAHFFGKAAMSEFPERIPQSAGVYALTLITSLFIAFLTVSYRSFIAAIENPVESLKTE
jgi:ABC-type antimicrobial peptide transport system permease subunit